MNPVAFHPEARAELSESARYYEGQRPGLGRRFTAAAREAVQRIQAYPILYPVLENEVRQCRILRFPYAVVYRPKADHIEVVAVMHLSRQPGYWSLRIKQD